MNKQWDKFPFSPLMAIVTILFPVPRCPVPMMCVVFAGVCLFSKSNISKFASSVFTKTEHCRFGNKINEYHLLWCRNPKIKHHNIIVLQLSIEPFYFLFKYILLGSRTRYISLLNFLTERWACAVIFVLPITDTHPSWAGTGYSGTGPIIEAPSDIN